MKTYADKAQDNRGNAAAARARNEQNQTPASGFVDNRAESIQMRMLMQIPDNSARLQYLAQLKRMANERAAKQEPPVQKTPNSTGLPDNLKSGIENLSGYSMDDVKVHYNSEKPAQLQALAYTQGTDIHVAPGQEQHLPHEAWHVVQQKEGRVKPTLQLKDGVNVNDDAGLEKEADVMGAEAVANVNNRTENVVQGKLKAMANNNLRVKPLSILKKFANNQPQTILLRSVIQRSKGKFAGIEKYKDRRKEQKRLRQIFGKIVSGDTHQSEHYYGFAVLNKTSGKLRREARKLEADAPAYMEVFNSHRAHPGTGSSSIIGPSGLSAETYRESQRALLESGDPSAAGQLNSLGYAFVPRFDAQAQSVEGRQAHNSFQAMINALQEVTYMQGDTLIHVPLSNEDRLEQLAARFAAENRRYPTKQEIEEMRRQLGM